MTTRFVRSARLASGLALAIALCAATASAQRQSATGSRGHSALGDSRQLLLVITGDWTSVAGTLERFERANAAGSWKPVGARVPVVVGRSGLAWGRGVQTERSAGPTKVEGDGKAPAGIFRLGTVFGQSADKPAAAAMPYLFLNDNVECVDDARSAHYNQLVAKPHVDRVDWTSSEKMWAEPLYKWGLVVEHNAAPVETAAGSCIFLHIWRGPGSATAGCTAMDESNLLDTIAWLDGAKHPLLVQLPRAEYERLKTAWGLPTNKEPRGPLATREAP